MLQTVEDPPDRLFLTIGEYDHVIGKRKLRQECYIYADIAYWDRLKPLSEKTREIVRNNNEQ